MSHGYRFTSRTPFVTLFAKGAGNGTTVGVVIYAGGVVSIGLCLAGVEMRERRYGVRVRGEVGCGVVGVGTG